MNTATESTVRRFVDIFASSAALVVLSPLLLGTAALVKLDSQGPAIYRQTRIGLHGRPFTLLKFRTMAFDSAPGLNITSSTDARITKLGGRLRATKLDELPQLFNVLIGEMSLVGPRPEVPEYVDQWPTDLKALILSTRPGITDPTTLKLRHEEVLLAAQPDPESYYRLHLLPAKAAAYAEYARTRSLASDASIAFRTVATLFRFQGGRP